VNFLLKAKHSILRFVFKYIAIIFLLSIAFSHSLVAQVERRVQTKPIPAARDTIPVQSPDSLRNLPADSLSVSSDSLSTAAKSKSDIETTIKYSANDSIIYMVGGKIVKLYGDAHIVYGKIELEADEIEINYVLNTLSAKGKRDSLGRRVGYPVFKDGNEVYETRDLVYNYKTGRARITEVVTKQGDGYLHGAVVYKNERDELLSLGNSYTTCDLEHPHFRIRSVRSKAIPNDKIISGPFYMEINDVPLPLGLPFGMFPAQKESKSGIIFPSYGDERLRGLFLRGGGYFFDISEYVKLAVTGDIYSKGSTALNVSSNYSMRYRYTGSLTFNYTKTRIDQRIEDKSVSNDYRLAWSHAPQSRGTGRFSASVNAATSTFNQNNFLGVNMNPNSQRLDQTTRRMNSNVSYAKTFAGTPFSMGINFRHQQDLITNEVEIGAPDVSFNMNNIYPFQKKTPGLKKSPLDNLNIRYNMNANNKITNNLGRRPGEFQDSIAPFNMDILPNLLQNAKKGIRHQAPIATTIKAFKHFTLTPSINYDERWYFEKLDWTYNPETRQLVVADTIEGFNRIANYSFSVGLNTRLYGMKNFKSGNIQAIRHIVNPNISFSYTPDFTKDSQDYFQKFELPGDRLIYKSRHEGFIFGGSNIGNSGSIGFGVSNSLEMKVKNERDSIARKIPLLNNLSANSSYNIVADSFKLSNINLVANTNILQGKLSLNLTATLDPYRYRVDSVLNLPDGSRRVFQRRIDSFLWEDGFSVGKISNANLAISTNLNPKARENENDTRGRILDSDMSDSDKQFLLNNPDVYVDFSIPWSLSINYNLSYVKRGFEDPRIIQTINLRGDLSLTEKWKVNYTTGYDIANKDITITTIGINRDLHCWAMAFNWTPFGRFQNYTFNIRVKSSMLKDLKIDRNRSFFDNF
jgi:hypothetical protein